MQQKSGKILIFSAPSGSGKTTVVKHLLQKLQGLSFSVSATSRPLRKGETQGKDYFFISAETFKERIAQGDFLEWEEVYEGIFYGSLKSEADRMLTEGKHVLFDVDVVGGLNIKKYYGNQALAVFVKAPSIVELRNRLEQRSTDSAEMIDQRIEKAAYEMTFADRFDYVLVNDDLTKTLDEILQIVKKFISQP